MGVARKDKGRLLLAPPGRKIDVLVYEHRMQFIQPGLHGGLVFDYLESLGASPANVGP